MLLRVRRKVYWSHEHRDTGWISGYLSVSCQANEKIHCKSEISGGRLGVTQQEQIDLLVDACRDLNSSFYPPWTNPVECLSNGNNMSGGIRSSRSAGRLERRSVVCHHACFCSSATTWGDVLPESLFWQLSGISEEDCTAFCILMMIYIWIRKRGKSFRVEMYFGKAAHLLVLK